MSVTSCELWPNNPIVAAEMGHSIQVLFQFYPNSTANDVSGRLSAIKEALCQFF